MDQVRVPAKVPIMSDQDQQNNQRHYSLGTNDGSWYDVSHTPTPSKSTAISTLVSLERRNGESETIENPMIAGMDMNSLSDNLAPRIMSQSLPESPRSMDMEFYSNVGQTGYHPSSLQQHQESSAHNENQRYDLMDQRIQRHQPGQIFHEKEQMDLFHNPGMVSQSQLVHPNSITTCMNMEGNINPTTSHFGLEQTPSLYTPAIMIEDMSIGHPYFDETAWSLSPGGMAAEKSYSDGDYGTEASTPGDQITPVDSCCSETYNHLPSSYSSFTTTGFPPQYTGSTSSLNSDRMASPLEHLTQQSERLEKDLPLYEQLKQSKVIWNKILTTNKKGVYKCNHCTEKFTKLDKFAQHLDYYQISRLFKCKHYSCPWSIIGLNSASELRRHLKHQHNEKGMQYNCEYCSKPFNRSDSVQRHEKLVHQNKSSRYNKRINKAKTLQLQKSQEEARKTREQMKLK